MFLKIAEHLRSSKYTNEHLIGSNHTYQKFILLTYRRSGANYFLDLLRSHPQIVSFAGLYEKDKIAFFYPGYPPVDCKKTLRYRDKYPLEFLRKRVYRNYSDDIKAVGFKIVYELKQQQVLDYLRTLPDLKVLNLQRRNLLRQHLSDMIAVKTNKWHAISKEHEGWVKNVGGESRGRILERNDEAILPEDFKIALNYEDCLQEFKNIRRLINEFSEYFAPEQVLVIYYEDLIARVDEETEKVLEFLGVENRKLTSRFIKINNKKLSEVISNYSEMKDRFAGTQWSVFFED